MKLLDRHPITDRSTLMQVQGELVDIYRTQIVVGVSIGDKRRFPALLDTGHSHNMSIARRHLQRWSGAKLEQIGELAIGRERVPQFDAKVDIYRSVKGVLSTETYPLEMPQGFSVIDDASEEAPGLPIIGLRTHISNKLKLIVDGAEQNVTLKTDWL